MNASSPRIGNYSILFEKYDCFEPTDVESFRMTAKDIVASETDQVLMEAAVREIDVGQNEHMKMNKHAIPNCRKCPERQELHPPWGTGEGLPEQV